MRAILVPLVVLLGLPAGAADEPGPITQVRLLVRRFQVDNSVIRQLRPGDPGIGSDGEMVSAVLDTKQLKKITARPALEKLTLTTLDGVPAQVIEGERTAPTRSLTLTPTVNDRSVRLDVKITSSRSVDDTTVRLELSAARSLQAGQVFAVTPGASTGLYLFAVEEVVTERKAPNAGR